GPPAEQLADKQVVAVIAYLQRLGTDLTRAPDIEEAPVEEGVPAEVATPSTPPTTLGSVKGGR
ncbi:MAG: hypothetical protein AAGB26_04700, partial [Planctomycetota bacterium]